MNSSSQNKQDDAKDDKAVVQRCLRHAWANYQKYSGSKIMMGPGMGNDTRHFWIVKTDGMIVDTTPGYDAYPYYSQGKVFDFEKNRDILDKLDFPPKE